MFNVLINHAGRILEQASDFARMFSMTNQDPFSRPTRFDIAAVLHLLSSPTSPLLGHLPLLPPELALDIIDLAQYWKTLHVSLGPDAETSVSAHEGSRVLLRTPPIPTSKDGRGGRIRRVDFRTVSHDQGWSSYQDLQGTYDGSYTWFEAAFISSRPLLMGGGDDDDEQSERLIISRNIHASREWKEHNLSLGADHPILQKAKPGQQMALIARAMYGRWVNHIKEAEVTIYLSWP
jgi:hypothetical protein